MMVKRWERRSKAEDDGGGGDHSDVVQDSGP